MSAITEARFTQLFTGVIFVSRAPTFSRRYGRPTCKIVKVDRRFLHVEESHVLPDSRWRDPSDMRAATTTTTMTMTVSFPVWLFEKTPLVSRGWIP